MTDPQVQVPEITLLDTPFKRRIAVAVALLAFLGAVLGVAASLTAGREEQRTREAEQVAVTALADQSIAYARLYEAVGGATEYRLLRQRAEMARFRAMLTPTGADAATVPVLEDAAAAVADLSQDLSGMPFADESQRFATELLVQPRVTTLQAEATRETAAGWGDESDRYVLGTTLLAIALSLLGLSLTVSPGATRPLVWPAGLISASVVAIGVQTAVTPVVSTPAAAWQAVAEGDRLAGLRRFDDAVEAYSDALRLRRDYAVALRQRATARVLADSFEGQTSAYAFATTSDRARRLAVADLDRALELEPEDYATLVNQGAHLFHLRDYARSQELTEQALELEDELPLPWSNLGLVQAARGDADAARATYDELIRRALDRPDPLERSEIFAVSRTTLELLAHREPERASLALDLEGRLVAAQARALTGRDTPGNGAAEVDGLRIHAVGPRLQASFTHRGIPADAVVSWIGYARQGPDHPWVQRPDLVAISEFGLAEAGQATSTLIERWCPATGHQYRIEFWMGAERMAMATTTTLTESETTSYLPSYDPAGRFSACRPPDWRVEQDVPGLLSFSSPTADTTVAVRAVPIPAELAANPDAAIAAALDAQAADLGGAPLVETSRGSYTLSDVAGTASQRWAGGTGEYVWVWGGVGTDGLLRVVGLRYPEDRTDVVIDLVNRIGFSPRL